MLPGLHAKAIYSCSLAFLRNCRPSHASCAGLALGGLYAWQVVLHKLHWLRPAAAFLGLFKLSQDQQPAEFVPGGKTVGRCYFLEVSTLKYQEATDTAHRDNQNGLIWALLVVLIASRLLWCWLVGRACVDVFHDAPRLLNWAA